MLIGIVVGLAGLAVAVIGYLNRNELSDKSPTRQLAPYALAGVIAIGLGVLVVELTAHQTDICGGLTNCRR